MMYLLDTNIWLERLLEQDRAGEVGQFLDQMPSDQLLITDFSFHSIGVVLYRLNQMEAFLQFVRDAFVDGGVELVSLMPDEVERLVEVVTDFGLDFDDAYQYVAAEKYDSQIVSFDSDFDKSERGRVAPRDITVTK